MSSLVGVAMSGGVDSSLAAILLHRGGERVVGASLEVVRPAPAAMRDGFARAEAMCRALDVPYARIELSRDFRRMVIDDFARTYVAGRTPNPCVICNPTVKFGLFADRLRQWAIEHGHADTHTTFTFATGHYARIGRRNGCPVLLRGRDRTKDQSYMLYRLGPERLDSVIFPLGDRSKEEVVREARELGLPAAEAAESQDACFVPSSYTDVVAEHLGHLYQRPGNIVDIRGHVLGTHTGYLGYTIGQRRGLGLGDGPWYVAAIDAATNTIQVGRREEALSAAFTVTDCVWYGPAPSAGAAGPAAELECTCKVRFQSRDIPCKVRCVRSGASAAAHAAAPPAAHAAARAPVYEVSLGEDEFVTPGQSAVFYDEERVIGGGIIRPDERERRWS